MKDNSLNAIGSAVKNDLLNRGINTKEAARILGISPAGVSVYFSGRPFTAKAARKWSNAFNLNENYLISGIGRPSDYCMMSLTADESKLINMLRKKRIKTPTTLPAYKKVLAQECLEQLATATQSLAEIVK